MQRQIERLSHRMEQMQMRHQLQLLEARLLNATRSKPAKKDTLAAEHLTDSIVLLEADFQRRQLQLQQQKEQQ